MKIALGQRGDYAIRAVLELARCGTRRKSREIAAAMAIPEKYLPQILGLLVKAGLVTSVAGPEGGYALVRRPADISLLEVVEAAEGPVRSDRCALRGGPCRWEHACALHEPWWQAQQAVAEKLDGTSFADLVDADRKLEHLAPGKPAKPPRTRAAPPNPGTPSRKAGGGR